MLYDIYKEEYIYIFWDTCYLAACHLSSLRRILVIKDSLISLARLQLAAAHFLPEAPRREPPVLLSLLWLPGGFRVDFHILTVVFNL